MAVKSPKQQLVKNYMPRLRNTAICTAFLLNGLALAATISILFSTGLVESHLTSSIIIVVTQALFGIVTTIAIYCLSSSPTKHLLAAITHISGEHSSTTPPNPNKTEFQRTGFTPVLQTLYQLAARSNESSTITSDSPSPAVSQVGAQKFIERALDDTICGFAAFDHSRKLTYANKATPVRIDTDGNQSLDLIFNDIDTIEKWWDECEKTSVKAEKTWTRISNKLPGEDERRFFDVIASYNKESSSELVLTLVDRTHIYKRSEEELDFIAFAAHELRGPITIIRGYLDVLKGELSEVLQADQKELFSRLEVSASKLSGYINNILNTSRYDRRHLSIRPVETTVLDIYRSIEDDMAMRASSQKRLLSINIPDTLPTIGADTASLGEVFSNIIDNAIKYSGEGGTVTVSATSVGDKVNFIVEDRGIGMPSNVMSNLFQKFYRSHRSRETVAGTGIGLYISKAIVESHGGSIDVRSEDGHGSTFTISLPTYATIADKIKAGNNGNEQLINSNGSWIKNHSMYRG